MLDWGVLILGALIALVTTTKVHKIPIFEWLFLLVALATSFLIGSLAAGIVLQRRAAYLSLQFLVNADSVAKDYLDAPFKLLSIQSHLLEYTISALAVFALISLFGIVLGYVDPRTTT
jgi:hypothetical protein